ncbi:MAG TPA: hypothetical protein PKZ76_12675 [Xanthomonadaceae bacterium]|nr:hypothetical protein [Xanthomonadaceae bacterium]
MSILPFHTDTHPTPRPRPTLVPQTSPANDAVACACATACAEWQRRQEDKVAALMLVVEALVNHTRCPSPAPRRPQTMHEWLT